MTEQVCETSIQFFLHPILSHIALSNRTVRWWSKVKGELDSATTLVGTPKLLWRAYWSAHQRFFKEMCICSKVDEVVSQAKQYLESDNHAIVIGLQSTGESGMETACPIIRICD